MLERPTIGDESRFDAVRDAIRTAARDERAIFVRGHGTLGETPPRDALIISPPELTEPVGYWPQDMVIRVPAGMVLTRVHEILAERGQELPIDAACADRTSVGGLIASGLCGSRRLSRGGLRDQLLGLTIIDARNDVLSLGGRVVKNVAGYDLCKLLLGSWGWLALIVEATFRVRARPESSRAIVVALDNAGEAESYAATLLASPLSPASLDWVDFDLAQNWRIAERAAIIVGFEGMTEDVGGQIARVETLLSRRGRIVERDEYAALRGRLADMALNERGHIRAALRSGDVIALIDRVRELAPSITAAAHLGSGIALFDLSNSEHDARAALIELLDEMNLARLIPRPIEARLHEPMLRLSEDARWMLGRVKTAIDPLRIFGRGGRFDAAIGSIPTAAE